MIVSIRPLCLLVALSLAGCSSNHDLKRDGPNLFGGGFVDEEVRPGLYLIKAFSNTSPLSTLESAKRTFIRRADALCGTGEYTIVNSNLDSYQSSTPLTPPPRVSFMAGHVLCSNSKMSVEDARKVLSLD